MMARNPPPQGSILQYPYLWARQRDAGETEGRKTRPVCLLLRIKNPEQDLHHLFLLPITSKQPSNDEAALEIPDTERRRSGLTRYARAWVIVGEYNYDVAERSYYYEPGVAVLGTFSAPFLREIAKVARSSLSRSGGRVDRTV